MGVKIGLVFLTCAAMIAMSQAQSSTYTYCYLDTGLGCRNTSIFTYEYKGINSALTGQCCKKSYNLKINSPQTGATDVYCTFSTRDPYRYSYSISHHPNVTSQSSLSPIIYSYYQNIRIFPKYLNSSASAYGNNYFYSSEFHSKGYRTSVYKIENKKVYASGSGITHRMGSPFYFVPTVQPLYIGINRLHGGTSSRQTGAGLCRVSCRVNTATVAAHLKTKK